MGLGLDYINFMGGSPKLRLYDSNETIIQVPLHVLEQALKLEYEEGYRKGYESREYLEDATLKKSKT